jgi:hypothetical protein
MDGKTLEALKASIEHWRRLENDGLLDAQVGPEFCALCRIFHPFYAVVEAGQDPCKGCPVAESDSGGIGCIGTPYSDAASALEENEDEAFRIAARAEREFLESLLPPIQGITS